MSDLNPRYHCWKHQNMLINYKALGSKAKILSLQKIIAAIL